MPLAHFFPLVAVLSVLGALPANWKECPDGGFSQRTRGALDKSAPMLSISLDPSSGKTVPVVVRAMIRDSRDVAISFVEANVMAVDFDFDVTDSNGNQVQPRAKLDEVRQAERTEVGNRRMQPGDSTTYVINLSDYYDFQPGQSCHVRISRMMALAPTWQQHEKIESNVLSISLPK